MVMTSYFCCVVCCRRRYARRREDAADYVMSDVSVVVIPNNFSLARVIEAELNLWSLSPDDDKSVSCMSSTSSWLVTRFLVTLDFHSVLLISSD